MCQAGAVSSSKQQWLPGKVRQAGLDKVRQAGRAPEDGRRARSEAVELASGGAEALLSEI